MEESLNIPSYVETQGFGEEVSSDNSLSECVAGDIKGMKDGSLKHFFKTKYAQFYYLGKFQKFQNNRHSGFMQFESKYQVV